MTIRKYKDSDCAEVSALFYNTVHMVNAQDYSAAQLDAWANNSDLLKSKRSDLLAQHTLVAVINDKIVGFGSIDKSGCLDLLYVHKDFLKHGIATALCDELEKGFSAIVTYASITAQPFFEKRGYTVLKAQEVVRSGIKLKNFEMVKTI